MVRAVRVADTDIFPEEDEAAWDMMSSVAPTLQCAGYTGIAYASTSLYVDSEGADSTRDDGGYDVNEVSVWVWTGDPDERS